MSIGVQVVYIGGIEPTLDGALYKAAGRDVNDEGCTIQGEQRRDMFWRCESEAEATDLAARIAGIQFAREVVVSIKSEDEHFEEKMLAVEASLPQVFGRINRNPRRRHYRRWSDERIWREFMAGCLARHPPRLAAEQADEAYALYRERFPVREPELDDDEPTAEDTGRPQ